MRKLLEDKLVRSLLYIISVVTLINALFFIGIGIYISGHTWYEVAKNGWEIGSGHGIHLLEAVDIFLLAVVIIVLSHGLKSLVTSDSDHFNKIDKSRLHNLKDTLWRSVLTVLIVHFLAVSIIESTYDYTILYLPASILLLTVSLYFMNKSERKH